jgi:hypothetical protein
MTRAALLSLLVSSAALAGSEEPSPDPFALDVASAIKLSVGHTFDRAVARERIGYLLEYWGKRFGVQSEWHGDRVFLTGRVLGVEIKAIFSVQEKAVFAMAYDPGTFLASAAQSYVNKKLRKYLHPTYEDP